jgi:hypothetical protein
MFRPTIVDKLIGNNNFFSANSRSAAYLLRGRGKTQYKGGAMSFVKGETFRGKTPLPKGNTQSFGAIEE